MSECRELERRVVSMSEYDGERGRFPNVRRTCVCAHGPLQFSSTLGLQPIERYCKLIANLTLFESELHGCCSESNVFIAFASLRYVG